LTDPTAERIAGTCRAVLGSRAPQPEGRLLAEVERLWQAARSRKGPALFNGNLFSVAERTGGSISGFIAEYRWFIAQRMNPGLTRQLDIRPLSVTGYLQCDDGVIVGRRSDWVEQNPGEWEFVPSGTVDPSSIDPDGHVDFQRALLTELGEEIGIAEDQVALPLEPFVIVEDHDAMVTDVVLRGHLRASAASVMSAFDALRNREYTEIMVLPLTSVGCGCPVALTPVSRAIVKAAVNET